MEDLSKLSKLLEKAKRNAIMNLIEAQHKIAEDICKDAKHFAPGEGSYKESIQVSNTTLDRNIISTDIYTDVVVKAKSNGNEYNLGYLLENGTLEHAIPNAFGLGNTYGHFDRYWYWHKGTMDKDWHPGFRPLPHFIPSLLLNK